MVARFLTFDFLYILRIVVRTRLLPADNIVVENVCAIFFSSELSNVSSRLEGVSVHLFVYLICQIICDCDVVEIIFKMKSVCTGILVCSEIATYICKRPQYFWPCVTIHCYSALSICKKKKKKSASCGNWAHFSVSSSSPSPEVKGKGTLPLTPISNNPKNALWQLPENRCRLLPMKPGSVVRQAVCPLPRTAFCYSHMHKKKKKSNDGCRVWNILT